MPEPFLFLFYIYIYIYIHVYCIAILLYANDRSRDYMLQNVHVMCLFHGCAIFFLCTILFGLINHFTTMKMVQRIG